MNCQGSSQLTDFASLASALARFGKVGREATNQKVESSSPSGRTTFTYVSSRSSNKNACFRRVTWKRVSVDVLRATSMQPLPQAEYKIKLCFWFDEQARLYRLQWMPDSFRHVSLRRARPKRLDSAGEIVEPSPPAARRKERQPFYHSLVRDK